MQIEQLFIILQHAIANSVTVFSNPTKLAFYLFIFLIKLYFNSLFLIAKSKVSTVIATQLTWLSSVLDRLAVDTLTALSQTIPFC